MFRLKKNEITIVADKKYCVDIEAFENQYVKMCGLCRYIHIADDKVYRTFTTKLTVKEVMDLLEKHLYKCKASNCGGNLIFVNFK